MTIINKIKELAEFYNNEVINIRRHIHENPELSFQEYKTSEYICSVLTNLGVSYKKGYVNTGIVAKIEGKNPDKKIIALRADMDALPVIENYNHSIRSNNEGVMHACGHDAHSASLLGTMMILNDLKEYWEGTILFIFQPGEELCPGGAKLMMEQGALDNPKPEIIIGQHVLPDMPTGDVGFRKGMYMASGDEIFITVKSTGGHGAMPHNYPDVVVVASNIIVAMQQIVSRVVPAYIPTVLSFGKFIAEGATNVIPPKVEIEGTLRTMNEEWRTKIKEKIKKIAYNTADIMGAECIVNIKDGYPVVNNNDKVTEISQKAAYEYLGKEHVHNMDLRMTAEDFGYYSQEYPSTFYRFGVKQPDNEITGSLHSSDFNLNENSLLTSTGLMAYIAISNLI